MDSHFMKDVFELACDQLREKGAIGKGRMPVVKMQALIEAAARKVIEREIEAMKAAVRASEDDLIAVLQERAEGKIPTVDFHYGEVRRPAV